MNRREYAGLFLGATALVGTSATGAADRVVDPDGNDSRRDGEVSSTSGSGEEATTSAGSDSQTTETGTTEGSGSFGPRTFTGFGTSTVEGLDLRPGPIVATFSHDGESNFVAELLTVEGEAYQDVLLTNLIGEVEGSQVRSVGAGGPHVLNVDADGEWELTLEQPPKPTPLPLPVSTTGTGPTAVDAVDFDGLTRLEGSHDGESNFVVETVPLDPDGFGTLLFNEIGAFEGTTTVRVDAPAFVNVAADGEWSLSFSE